MRTERAKLAFVTFTQGLASPTTGTAPGPPPFVSFESDKSQARLIGSSWSRSSSPAGPAGRKVETRYWLKVRKRNTTKGLEVHDGP
jgi:hypothetical protein